MCVGMCVSVAIDTCSPHEFSAYPSPCFLPRRSLLPLLPLPLPLPMPLPFFPPPSDAVCAAVHDNFPMLSSRRLLPCLACLLGPRFPTRSELAFVSRYVPRLVPSSNPPFARPMLVFQVVNDGFDSRSQPANLRDQRLPLGLSTGFIGFNAAQPTQKLASGLQKHQSSVPVL